MFFVPYCIVLHSCCLGSFCKGVFFRFNTAPLEKKSPASEIGPKGHRARPAVPLPRTPSVGPSQALLRLSPPDGREQIQAPAGLPRSLNFMFAFSTALAAYVRLCSGARPPGSTNGPTDCISCFCGAIHTNPGGPEANSRRSRQCRQRLSNVPGNKCESSRCGSSVLRKNSAFGRHRPLVFWGGLWSVHMYMCNMMYI